jgi:hypothetical protein
MPWHEQKDAGRIQPKEAKIHQPTPFGLFTQPRRPDAMDVDTIPKLPHRETPRRIIITSARSHGGVFLPCLRQSHREIGEVLGRGHMIGVEALIDEEDSHDNVGSVLKQNGPEVNLRPV